MPKRRTYSKSKKMEIVRQWASGEKSPAEIVEAHGLYHIQQVVRWKRSLDKKNIDYMNPYTPSKSPSSSITVDNRRHMSDANAIEYVELKDAFIRLTLENERLKNLLGHTKRQSDRPQLSRS